MKKRISTFVIVVAFALVAFFGHKGLTTQSNERLTQSLSNIGIHNVAIGRTHLHPSGVEFNDITFGADGFGDIDVVMQDLSWLKNIFSQSTDFTAISKITINAIPEDFSLFTIPNILSSLQKGVMTLNQLNLNLLQFNIMSGIGDLRVESKLSAQTAADGSKSIQAVTWARQYQLGFEIPISGIVQTDGSYLFESSFNDGKFNAGPIRLSRTNGWMSIHGEQGTLKTAALQMDTGSAAVFNLPLQKINIAYSQSAQTSNGILRANVTGLPNTKIALDYNKTPQSEQGTLFVDLPTKDDATAFWKRLLENSDTSEALLTKLANNSGLSLSVAYQPDRRFAGGPVPFSIMLTDTSAKTHRPILQGNILVYTDTLHLKGSLFGDSESIQDLKTVFGLPDSEADTPESLRFEASFKSFLKNALIHKRKN